jgi:hypothetical protein
MNDKEAILSKQLEQLEASAAFWKWCVTFRLLLNI